MWSILTILKQSRDSSCSIRLPERISDISTHDGGRRGHVPGSEDPSPRQSAPGPAHRWVSQSTPICRRLGPLSRHPHNLRPGQWLRSPPSGAPPAAERNSETLGQVAKGAGRPEGGGVVERLVREMPGCREGTRVTCRSLLWDLVSYREPRRSPSCLYHVCMVAPSLPSPLPPGSCPVGQWGGALGKSR